MTVVGEEGVGLGVAVAVAVPPVVAVTVAPGVLLDVAEAEAVALAEAVAVTVAVGVPLAGVTVTGACSSRKTMNGLLHQCSFVNATRDGVGLAAGVVLPIPPKLKPEHDTRKKLNNSRHAEISSHTCRRRFRNDKDRGTNIKKLLNNPGHARIAIETLHFARETLHFARW